MRPVPEMQETLKYVFAIDDMMLDRIPDQCNFLGRSIYDYFPLEQECTSPRNCNYKNLLAMPPHWFNSVSSITRDVSYCC